LKYNIGEYMKRYMFLILGLIFISTTLFSQSRIDSLENELIIAQSNERAVILINLIQEYRNIDPYKAIKYGEEVLTNIEDIDNEIDKAHFFNHLAWAYKNVNEFEKSREYTERGMECAIAIDSPGLKALAFNTLGSIFWAENQYDKALEKFLSALKIQEAQNDSASIACTLNNIGLIFFSTGDTDSAIEYFSRALSIWDKLDNQRDAAIAKVNMANMYGLSEEYEKSIEYFLSSLKNSEEIGDERLSGIILTNIAISYYNLYNNEKAEEFFNKALTLTKKNDDKGNIIRAYIYLGSIFKDMGNYNLALEKENEALQIAEEINDFFQIKYIYEEIADIYAQMNDFEKALHYHIRYKEINDSLFNIEKSEQITEMETKYETEKKEQQIVLLEKDNTIANMEITKQRSMLLYLTTGIILIVIFAIIVIRLFNQKAKTAKALAVANGKLEELSRTDPLTKLWNRRHMHEMINLEKTRVEREFKPFSFILMDIDHFKNVNDTYGHECGDYILATMAVILRSVVRKQDVVGRWGGEEFLLFLPSTSLKGALTIAESIRKKIADYPFNYSSTDIPITATLGVSQYEETASAEACIKLADDALYEGKESGRNRVVSVQEEV
jgi:diguanylate cyclase (GGDEF)-like protein